MSSERQSGLEAASELYIAMLERRHKQPLVHMAKLMLQTSCRNEFSWSSRSGFKIWSCFHLAELRTDDPSSRTWFARRLVLWLKGNYIQKVIKIA